MAKRSSYVCQQCGYSQVGWAGKCPNCGAWGSLVETFTETSKSAKGKIQTTAASVTPQKLIEIKSKKIQRTSTLIPELDRVLGGGLVSGQVILLAGEPGIGKSTLLLQVANSIAGTLYVSGEESGIQVKIRADRLGTKSSTLKFLESTDVDAIIASLEAVSPPFVIIDSIQTMSTSDLSGMAGSVGQVRECASRLLKWAKANGVPTVMVGHVTKQGSVAGPAVLAHIVDTVLWFEGDNTLTLRMLRPIKNRFGPTDEVGIFEMRDKGLVAIEETEMFLASDGKVAGTAVASIMEGTRSLLVEIQTLVVPSKLANPRRVVQGVDARRIELLVAVLARRCGLRILDCDVFVNVAGGLTLREPSADFAIALAIASSYLDKPLPKLVAIGEVGLLGEVRDVPQSKRRVTEAKRRGYKKVVTSHEFGFIREALRQLLPQ